MATNHVSHWLIYLSSGDVSPDRLSYAFLDREIPTLDPYKIVKIPEKGANHLANL